MVDQFRQPERIHVPPERAPAISEEMIRFVERSDCAALEKWFSDDTSRSPDDVDASGITLLQRCCSLGRDDAIKTLLAVGASPNAIARGLAPLFCAAQSGKASSCEILLDNGARVDVGVVHLTAAPLLYAAMEGHVDVIRLLLSRGAVLDAKGGGNAKGRDAEAWARKYDRTDAAALLADVKAAGGWRSFVAKEAEPPVIPGSWRSLKLEVPELAPRVPVRPEPQPAGLRPSLVPQPPEEGRPESKEDAGPSPSRAREVREVG